MTESPLRAVVAEDEPLQRRLLVTTLTDALGVQVVAEADNGAAAVEATITHAPDLLFLDVRMPELDAFQVIDAIGLEQMPVTVFVTAYDSYALRAFEVHALDYLLKPFDDERLALAVRRATERVRQRPGPGGAVLALLADLGERARYPSRLAVRTDGRIVFLDTELIDWIEADGKLVRFHLGKNSTETRESLSSVERQLDPTRFVRVHRSAVVNASRIVEMQPWFKGDHVIILRSGARITTGRSYRDAVRRLFTR